MTTACLGNEPSSNGTGSSDGTAAYADKHLTSKLVVTGKRSAEAAVTLSGEADEYALAALQATVAALQDTVNKQAAAIAALEDLYCPQGYTYD